MRTLLEEATELCEPILRLCEATKGTPEADRLSAYTTEVLDKCKRLDRDALAHLMSPGHTDVRADMRAHAEPAFARLRYFHGVATSTLEAMRSNAEAIDALGKIAEDLKRRVG